jgi:hypothetical protein
LHQKNLFFQFFFGFCLLQMATPSNEWLRRVNQSSVPADVMEAAMLATPPPINLIASSLLPSSLSRPIPRMVALPPSPPSQPQQSPLDPLEAKRSGPQGAEEKKENKANTQPFSLLSIPLVLPPPAAANLIPASVVFEEPKNTSVGPLHPFFTQQRANVRPPPVPTPATTARNGKTRKRKEVELEPSAVVEKKKTQANEEKKGEHNGNDEKKEKEKKQEQEKADEKKEKKKKESKSAEKDTRSEGKSEEKEDDDDDDDDEDEDEDDCSVEEGKSKKTKPRTVYQNKKVGTKRSEQQLARKKTKHCNITPEERARKHNVFDVTKAEGTGLKGLRCKVCACAIDYLKYSTIKSHLTSKSHQKALAANKPAAVYSFCYSFCFFILFISVPQERGLPGEKRE